MTKLTIRESTLTRLTDTQRIVLSRAAQREDGAAALSEGMTEKAAQKLAAALVRDSLSGRSGRSLACQCGNAVRRAAPTR